MPTVVTNQFSIAKALMEGNYSKYLQQRKAEGYLVSAGEITSRNFRTNTNNLTAPKKTSLSVPAPVSGNYTIDFDVGLNLSGANATLPRLTVSGKDILKNGVPFRLKGPSLLYSDNIYTDFSAVQRLNMLKEKFPDMNCVRIPIHYHNSTGYLPSYASTLYNGNIADHLSWFADPVVKWGEDNGIYVILDWHRISDWDTEDTRFKAFWDVAADRYKDLPNVLYELFNEPIGPATFDQPGWNTFRTQLQLWVNYVRAIAPSTLFLCPSPSYCQYTQFIPNNPISDSRVAYVHHMYPIHMPGGSINNISGGSVADTNLATKTAWMDENFGNAANTIPVVMTEWGYTLTAGTDVGGWIIAAKSRASYAEPLRDYMDSKGISWCSWSLDPNGGPNMLTNNTTLSDFGSFVATMLGGT